ncbi:MAG: DMT family transporter [Candidatus Paceibacterota bacterium]
MTSVSLFLALVAYFFISIAFIIDKYLLSAAIPRPFAYAFWVTILSSAVVVFIPLGVQIPDLSYLAIAFISGSTFFVGLIYLYQAIRKTNVSIASTHVSVMSVVFAYVLSIFLLGDHFFLSDLLAFAIVVLGIMLIGKTGQHVWGEAFIGGMLFGISLVTLKMSFDLSNFVNGFFWTRIGFIGAAFMTLLFPSARKEIFGSYKKARVNSKVLFILSKIIAGLGFILLYLAIQLGNVAMINALLGLQFAFIFLLSLILGHRIPEIAEHVSRAVLIKKFSGIVVVIVGLVILFK